MMPDFFLDDKDRLVLLALEDHAWEIITLVCAGIGAAVGLVFCATSWLLAELEED